MYRVIYSLNHEEFIDEVGWVLLSGWVPVWDQAQFSEQSLECPSDRENILLADCIEVIIRAFTYFYSHLNRNFLLSRRSYSSLTKLNLRTACRA
jgi:hypothetical protein